VISNIGLWGIKGSTVATVNGWNPPAGVDTSIFIGFFQMIAPSHRNSTDPAESLRPKAHSCITIADPFICVNPVNLRSRNPKARKLRYQKTQEKGTRRIKNALFIDTIDFARPPEMSPNPGHGHHWSGNAESFFSLAMLWARV
jgi:hypothetical protein